jgi:ribosomal protein S30
MVISGFRDPQNCGRYRANTPKTLAIQQFDVRTVPHVRENAVCYEKRAGAASQQSTE